MLLQQQDYKQKKMIARKAVSGQGHVRIEAYEDVLSYSIDSKANGEADCKNHINNVVNATDDTMTPGPGMALMKSEVVSMRHAYPFRFIVPEDCTSSICRWIYPVTFGGGLVGGDNVMADVCVGSNCACVVTSQESTKIYHCHHSKPTQLYMTYTIGEHALLCVLQDPVVCFSRADYRQTQTIKLTQTSSLVFLDWTLSGRNALSESWSFKRYINTVEIHLENKLALREMQELEDLPHMSVAKGMNNFQVIGMCIALGRHAKSLCDELNNKYGRKLDLGETLNKDLIVSVSPLRYTANGQTLSGVYLRFMATSASMAAKVVTSITAPMLSVIGADPFEHKL